MHEIVFQTQFYEALQSDEAANGQEERRMARVAFSRTSRRLVITYVRGEVAGATLELRNSLGIHQ